MQLSRHYALAHIAAYYAALHDWFGKPKDALMRDINLFLSGARDEEQDNGDNARNYRQG